MNLDSSAHQDLKKGIETVNMIRETMDEKDQSLWRGEWLKSTSLAPRLGIHGGGLL